MARIRTGQGFYAIVVIVKSYSSFTFFCGMQAGKGFQEYMLKGRPEVSLNGIYNCFSAGKIKIIVLHTQCTTSITVRKAMNLSPQRSNAF